MGRSPVDFRDFGYKIVLPVRIDEPNRCISREVLASDPAYQRVTFLDVFLPQRTVDKAGLFDLWLRPLRFSTTPAQVIEDLRGSGTLPATLEFLVALVKDYGPEFWQEREVLFLGSAWEVVRDGMAYLVIRPREDGKVQVRVFCGWSSKIDPERTLIATVPYPRTAREATSLEEMTVARRRRLIAA